MNYKKIIVFFAFFFFLATHIFAQKVITDGTITYTVSVVSGKDQPGISEAFDGATLTVALKGALARTDLKSSVRNQTVFYNSKDGTAVILKESGTEKYMINLTSSQWQQYNRKFAGVVFKKSGETKVIEGLTCVKATGVLKDGSKMEVFYSPDMKPLASGYEYAFRDLPGLPLQYEISTGSIVVRYLATSVQSAPVNASQFDLPKSGYKILDFNQ